MVKNKMSRKLYSKYLHILFIVLGQCKLVMERNAIGNKNGFLSPLANLCKDHNGLSRKLKST